MDILLELDDGHDGFTVYHTSVYTPGNKNPRNGQSWEEEVKHFYDKLPVYLKTTFHYKERQDKRPIPITLNKTDIAKDRDEFLENTIELKYYEGYLVDLTVDIYNLDLKKENVAIGHVITIALANTEETTSTYELNGKTKSTKVFDLSKFGKVAIVKTAWAWPAYNTDGTKINRPYGTKHNSHLNNSRGIYGKNNGNYSGKLNERINKTRELSKEEVKSINTDMGKKQKSGIVFITPLQKKDSKEKLLWLNTAAKQRYNKEFKQLSDKEKAFIEQVVYKKRPQFENIPIEESITNRIIRYFIKS